MGFAGQYRGNGTGAKYAIAARSFGGRALAVLDNEPPVTDAIGTTPQRSG
jgi:hypothetical protein